MFKPVIFCLIGSVLSVANANAQTTTKIICTGGAGQISLVINSDRSIVYSNTIQNVGVMTFSKREAMILDLSNMGRGISGFNSKAERIISTLSIDGNSRSLKGVVVSTDQYRKDTVSPALNCLPK